YTPELVQLRARVRSDNVDMLGFVAWTNNHYASICHIYIAELEHGDSLHLPATPDILPILRWVFAGLQYAPSPNQTYIRPGVIDRQSTLAGGGSCGIASTNFIESRVGLGIPRWRAAQSAEFRDVFLQEVLLYH
ncbi:hypothetical protein B0H16DRAFT_1246677, partial [Mycena metata]